MFACMTLGVFMPGQIALMPWAYILGALGISPIRSPGSS